MKRLLLALVWLALALSAAAKTKVVAANSILWDLTRTIGGSDIECRSLIPIGVDPHAFQPSPTDVRRMGEADVIVVNGLGFEPWLQRLIDSSGFKGHVVVASAGVPALHSAASDHAPGESLHHDDDSNVDPHAWHDLARAAAYAATICDALAAADPASEPRFRERAALLRDRLLALHGEMKRVLAEVPVERRRIVTSHDSLAYLADAYDLKVIPIFGLNPDREPNARELAGLIKRIRSEAVPAVFIEATTNPKIPRLLAEEAGVKVVTELYTDSLGEPGSPGSTFLGMARSNLRTLVAALSP